jgi:hypothetical protein
MSMTNFRAADMPGNSAPAPAKAKKEPKAAPKKEKAPEPVVVEETAPEVQEVETGSEED